MFMELVGFQVTSERLADETFVLSVAGELDLYTAPELERALLAADGARSVLVELSKCTFIDSSALGILIAAKRRLGVAEARLSLAGAAAAIRRPFELTGLDREFPFHQSLASALDGGTA
jgi:anti-sigma B factor antagonist